MGKKADAIQPDADNNLNEEVVPTPHLNPRAAAMEEIAAKYEAAVDEELGLSPEDIPPEVNDEAVKPVDQIDKQMAQPETQVTKRVKIDGEERDVTEDELIRNYQKDQTASKRLEQAALRQKELDAREAELAAREAQLTKQSSLPEPQATEDQAVDDAVADQFLNAIYEGNSSEAKKLLGKLQLAGRGASATPQPTVDLDAIADRAAARATEAIKADEAMEKFKTAYQDIVSDPYLAKVADGFLDEELRSKPFADALEEAGKRTREWITAITPKPTEQPNGRRTQVLEKKATIDNLPSQSSVSSSAAEEDDDSASDIIRNMRKARGLPV
jgi:hypothetical protein